MADGTGGALDWQAAFNIAAGIIGGLGSVLLALVMNTLNKLRADHDALVKSLPDTYARRDDFLALGAEIKDGLRRIEEKLDRKADK